MNSTLDHGSLWYEIEKNGPIFSEIEKNDFVCLGDPVMEYINGTKKWMVDRKFHRLDGPAIERDDGTKKWLVNDKFHRLDGPAIEYPDGDKSWYIYNQTMCDVMKRAKQLQGFNAFLKLTFLQNKSRKFNEWLFDPDHYAGKWHKKNMLRDFQDS